MENCNNCRYISITEEEQNLHYHLYKTKPDHVCKKHNMRIIHRYTNGNWIFPCHQCNGDDFEQRES